MEGKVNGPASTQPTVFPHRAVEYTGTAAMMSSILIVDGNNWSHASKTRPGPFRTGGSAEPREIEDK
jgi:hypothetical protein